MAWLLFIDESGQDRASSTYEVLAGVAIKDCNIWPLIKDLHETEIACFGRRYSESTSELKGRKILKRKVFRHAQLNCQVHDEDIPHLARSALDDGANASVESLKALALAKLRYVSMVFDLCKKYECKVFASIVDASSPKTTSRGLRKDYAYLFERFYYFLQFKRPQQQGIVVFDELEKSMSHILVDQAHRYFKDTATGRLRSSVILPEPFFVHSDLTTGIQIADLAAYCISWGFRDIGKMTGQGRKELASYVKQIKKLEYLTRRTKGTKKYRIWSICYVTDLRTRREKNNN